MSFSPGPWFKFYPSDWRAEASLRAVSMAARGLWMEMLCLMHEAEPRGHLLLNGRPVTDAQLAALAGVPLDIAQALLGELESAGTFSRTRAGVIYSRRMRNDTAVSAKQRANVEKRWNSAVVQRTEKPRKTASRITERIPKKPEARSQIPPEAPQGANPGTFSLVPDEPTGSARDWAEEIWKATPKPGRERSSKADLHRALEAAAERGADMADVKARLAAYYASPDATKDGGRFAKGVHRMVQNDRWQAFAPQQPARPFDPNESWRIRVRAFQTDPGSWKRLDWGAPPGREPRADEDPCRAPAAVLAEFGIAPQLRVA